MKRTALLFLLLAVCLLLGSLAALVPIASAQRLPAHVRQNTVDRLFAQDSEIVLQVEKDWTALGTARQSGMYGAGLWTLAFLVPQGYYGERELTPEERKKYGLGPRWEYEFTGKVPSSRLIKIGRRVLKAVDFVNTWKKDPGVENWIVKFSYNIEPLHPGIPRLGPFKGEGRAMRPPWEDKWIYNASWEDGGLRAYDQWLEGQWSAQSAAVNLSGDWQGTKYWGEREIAFKMTLSHDGANVAGTLVSEPDPSISGDHVNRECRTKTCTYKVEGEYESFSVSLKVYREYVAGEYTGWRTSADVGISNPGKMLGGWIATKVKHIDAQVAREQAERVLSQMREEAERACKDLGPHAAARGYAIEENGCHKVVVPDSGITPIISMRHRFGRFIYDVRNASQPVKVTFLRDGKTLDLAPGKCLPDIVAHPQFQISGQKGTTVEVWMNPPHSCPK